MPLRKRPESGNTVSYRGADGFLINGKIPEKPGKGIFCNGKYRKRRGSPLAFCLVDIVNASEEDRFGCTFHDFYGLFSGVHVKIVIAYDEITIG